MADGCNACGLVGGTVPLTHVRTTNGGLALCRQCLEDINRKNPADRKHTSNAPHEGQAAQLYRELCEALRQRDAALTERDPLRAKVEQLERDAVWENDLYERTWHERDRLRDAARAFLLVLDRHEFSSISLRGPALDELRRLCE